MITSNKKYNFITHILKPALMMTCLFVLTSVTATAQAPCAPVDIGPPSDPALQVFEVEGKIQSFNNTAQKKSDEPPRFVPHSINRPGRTRAIVSWMVQRSRMFCQTGCSSQDTLPKLLVCPINSRKNSEWTVGRRKRSYILCKSRL